MILEQLINESKQTLSVTTDATSRYIKMREKLLKDVDSDLTAHPNITELIGGNPISIMYDNHSNHFDFMATVFRYNSFEMLVRNIPWVYRAYRAHGFSFDYFPVELEAWKKSIEKYLEPQIADEINAVYDWMIKNHNTMIELSQKVPQEEDNYPELKDIRTEFKDYILSADFHKCMEIANNILNKEKGLDSLYFGVIQPVMYEIGRLWEENKISVAEEHLATSIAGRIMAGLYAKLPIPAYDKGKAIVTCAPNEFHELGGRMLADILEADGWDVLFLGANTPSHELMALLEKVNPRFLAISLTLPFNIDKVEIIISSLKNSPQLSHIKVMVGGLAFDTDSELWKNIGADLYAKDPQSVLERISSW